MAINKVIYGSTTLVDLTADTVAPEVLMQGYTAHNCKGETITGTASGGGGLAYITELYSNDAVSITYTSTSAGTAKTISGISGIANYPMIVVIIEATETSAGSLKFVRSCTALPNTKYASGAVATTRYGSMQYYNSSSALTNLSSTSYGLWGYTFTAAGSLTIRGRCNASYFTSLTGTYKVRVLGIKFS